jgi:hypothetical protein
MKDRFESRIEMPEPGTGAAIETGIETDSAERSPP